MQTINTIVRLNDLKIYAHHGVLPQERATGAYFYINLKAEADFSSALQSDNLNDTVSYAAIYNIIGEEMAIPSALLEHVAGRILNRLFDTFPTIVQISLRIDKENPPMGADCKSAGIEVNAKR